MPKYLTAPGILMLIATLTFWAGRYRFVHIPPGGRRFLQETFSRRGLGALQGADYFLFFTLLMLVAAVLFVVVARYYRGQSYIHAEREEINGLA